jgi:hypothetical protein
LGKILENIKTGKKLVADHVFPISSVGILFSLERAVTLIPCTINNTNEGDVATMA